MPLTSKPGLVAPHHQLLLCRRSHQRGAAGASYSSHGSAVAQTLPEATLGNGAASCSSWHASLPGLALPGVHRLLAASQPNSFHSL